LLRFYEQKRYKRRKKSAVPDLFSSPWHPAIWFFFRLIEFTGVLLA
jgi:hypothetical protein